MVPTAAPSTYEGRDRSHAEHACRPGQKRTLVNGYGGSPLAQAVEGERRVRRHVTRSSGIDWCRSAL